MLDAFLFEIELSLGLVLDFTKRDANDAEWCRETFKELADDADNVGVGMDRLFEKDVFVERNIVVVYGPEVNSARVEVFATEAQAGIFGKMDGAGFDLFVCEPAGFEDILTAD